MEDRERIFARTQPSRGSVKPQSFRKAPDGKMERTTGGMGMANRAMARQKVAVSPRAARRLPTTHTALDNLKQWELVENDKGLQVVEKRTSASRGSNESPTYRTGTTVFSTRSGTLPAEEPSPIPSSPATAIDANIQEKLKAFKDSKIVQPIRISQDPDSKVPVSLNLILNQGKGSAVESTDMLQRLEQQVKAIEIGTIASRARQLENSTDFGPEIQLRYREHEDLLRDVTDDEAEG